MNTIEENGIELTYAYGPDQSRYKGIWKNNATQYRKRIYASGYEINEETVNGVTTTQNISYVSSPSGLCAMYVEENGSGTFYYVHTDHLGSITSVTNANGNIIARQNFDAWGRRRKVQDYDYLPQNTSSTDNGLNNNGTLPKWLYRGYTGHEHLDEFALINMNARLYDPVVGMFLSPDNYIQAPGNTQNYNRYAYCLNNPLKYSDPSGNRFTSDDVGYIALAGVFGTASWKPIFNYSFGNATTGQAIGMYAVNATAFVASAGVGSAVSSALGNIGIIPGLLTGASTGFVSGSIVGAGNAWVTGASFSDGINSGVKKGAIGMSIGAITGGLRGGLRVLHLEKMTGDDINIWNGKVISFGGTGSNLYASTGKDLVIGADGKPISESEGGIIKGKQEAKEFLVEQGRTNEKEVALFGMEDEKHVVQPWENNDSKTSHNNMKFVEKYNYKIEQIKYQMHSHQDGSGPSQADVEASRLMGIPVYTVSPNGTVWVTYRYEIGYVVPIFRFPFYYGKPINW